MRKLACVAAPQDNLQAIIIKEIFGPALNYHIYIRERNVVANCKVYASYLGF